MRSTIRRTVILRIALVVVLALVAQHARAAEHIRIAAQRTGTLAWELAVIGDHGIDRQLNLSIETTELASTEAGQIALKGGSADLILSDWLWVARERGFIQAHDVAGNAKIRTGGGHIRAAHIRGTAQLETDGGNITVGEAGALVGVRTGGGQIDFGEVHGSVHAETGGGGVAAVI